MYKRLVAEVTNIDTSGFVLKCKYNTKQENQDPDKK